MSTTFDYENQAWIVDGRYVRCGHEAECECYGKIHEGEKPAAASDPGCCECVAPRGTLDDNCECDHHLPMTATEQEISDELAEIFG